MKMTRYIFLLLTMLLYSANLMAEPKEPSAEKLKELQEFKIKYLIQEMDLAADKQAEFTQIYTQYDNERTSLFRSNFQVFKGMHKKQNPTDAEYLNAAEVMATAKMKEGSLEQKYFNKLRSVLTPKQIYTLKRAEQKFERKLNEQRHKGKRK